MTDDDVMDEEAGAARAKMASASKAKKAAEAKKLAKENSDMKKSLSNVKAAIDDGD